MLIKSYAKVNLSLDVVGKREDGYHILKMIMQSIDLCDYVNIEKTLDGITISCDKEYVPTDSRNLAYKAAQLFLDSYEIESNGVHIDIVKNIPVSAGLAGGSSNAAAVLKGMRDMYRPTVTDEELMKLGLKIGADVPYCICGGTALCEGIGEIITPLEPFENQIMVLVKPPFGVSTKEIYGRLEINKIYRHPDTIAILNGIKSKSLKNVCRNMKNILENVTLKKHPLIRKIKMEMLELGACGALMSGSGPTVFAFFKHSKEAQLCFEKMKLKYKEVFLTKTI
jgi:4-diphosphocytidyl-2-C-methyl-D-erythritol kinase